MKYIFVTGMGRSGTSSLARLISAADRTFVEHEGVGDREYWLLSWYLPGQVYARPVLNREKQEIMCRTGDRPVYVDVNGYLQNSVNELREVFDNASIYHLVRDGRDVVRSLYMRRSDQRVHLIPKEHADIERWLDFDKFSQVCWNWNDTTQRLLDAGLPLLKLENVIGDYEYFRESFLDPEGLHVSHERWSEAVSERHNKTRSSLYRFLYARVKGKSYVSTRLPGYADWSVSQKSAFSDICGETMARLGYL